MVPKKKKDIKDIPDTVILVKELICHTENCLVFDVNCFAMLHAELCYK